jgi:hypothetical protein
MSKYDDVDWNKGACVGMPTSLFYAYEESKEIKRIITTDLFRDICLTCPIWRECLTYALSNENYGIWGGCTTFERESLKEGFDLPLSVKVIEDFNKRGISVEEIMGAVDEHKNHERGLANPVTN